MPTPCLDALAQALALDWHQVRVASRVQRHVEHLREVARQLSPAPDRLDRPQDAAAAETQFWDFLSGLQRTTPRAGLNAKTASFIDHLVAIAGRYGPHLFHCFDDPELPATTNQLEGFFGKTKQQARRALGCGSTTHSLVHNLGDEFLLAYQQVTAGSLDLLAEPIDPQAYRQARDKLKEQEQPARQRRSFVRRLSFHLNEILTRWRALI